MLTARHLLRGKYTAAEVGVTGGNFLVAKEGAVAVTENEGNARLSATFPKLHIAVVGIEKVIPQLTDLDLFWPLLSTSGTGQQVTVYNTVYFGPRQPGEVDGPEEMVVILLDNGRTNLLAQPDKRAALRCIRCGACLNVCPVYKNIGGHTYETTYSGPIGSVISPHLSGLPEHKHLSYASSLCGACTTVCPVRIPLHNLLLLNRQQAVEEGYAPTEERAAIGLWKLEHAAPLGPRFAARQALKDWSLGRLLGQVGWSKRRERPCASAGRRSGSCGRRGQPASWAGCVSAVCGACPYEAFSRRLCILTCLLALRIATGLGGRVLVITTLSAAIRSFVLPRNEVGALNVWVFAGIRTIFDGAARLANSYERRDRIMAHYAPVALVALPVVSGRRW